MRCIMLYLLFLSFIMFLIFQRDQHASAKYLLGTVLLMPWPSFP